MKKNKKNGIITINPIKLFKRFLKEKKLYSTFYYGTKFNKGLINYFKTTEPTRYITDIDKQNIKTTAPYGTYNIINNLNDEWYSKLMFLPQKEIIENKFETFLKKRGTLNLYESCFAPYYANKVNNDRKYSWGKKRKTIAYTTPINTWKDLLPDEYLTSAFDITDTIKTINFWESLNQAWLKELNQCLNKIKIIYK
jgi:hypothetical protein